MTPAERTEYILSLERKCVQERVDCAIAAAKQKNREDAINFAVNIYCNQLRLITLGMFYSALNQNQPKVGSG